MGIVKDVAGILIGIASIPIVLFALFALFVAILNIAIDVTTDLRDKLEYMERHNRAGKGNMKRPERDNE